MSLKYILAVLNSKLFYFWFYYRGKRKGDTLEIYAKPLKEVPLIEINKTEQKQFIDHVDSIISQKKLNIKADTNIYEKQIDKLVYKLYELTKDEIKIIEGLDN